MLWTRIVSRINALSTHSRDFFPLRPGNLVIRNLYLHNSRDFFPFRPRAYVESTIDLHNSRDFFPFRHPIAINTTGLHLHNSRDFFPFRPVFTKSVGLKTNFNRGFSRCFVYKNKYHSCLSHEDGGLLLTYPIRCHALFIFFWKWNIQLPISIYITVEIHASFDTEV